MLRLPENHLPENKTNNPVALFPVSFPVLKSFVCKSNLEEEERFAVAWATLLLTTMTTGALTLGAQGATAQTTPRPTTQTFITPRGQLTYDSEEGSVELDNNSFDLRTGELTNTSNIPLPDGLPRETREGQAIPVIEDGRLAPNTIELTTDINYIRNALDEALSEALDENRETTYRLSEDSLELTTQFELRQRPGSHAYGEGIEVIVTEGEAEEVRSQSAFVRGGVVTRGADGEALPVSNQVRVTYGADETVILRPLNIRRNGSEPSESGIYFNQDGEFVVEDLQNGGDRDFDDGNYLESSSGRGEADLVERAVEVTRRDRRIDTPLDPEIETEETEIGREIISTTLEMDGLSEEIVDWGSVEITETNSTRLGHATGARTSNNELLVYDRYAAANQARAGSDGLSYTGQLAPFANNPNVPPTLLTGNVTFDPFAGNNEAGLTTTVGITQFLTPTHRIARDIAGKEIVAENGSSRRLLEPAGLFTNRRLVGYVPAEPDEQVFSDPVTPINGIFELPMGQPVVVAPPEADKVGRGNAAYTDNVGGLLIENTSGAISFVPQWNGNGYAQEPLSLGTDEARRLIYALVPQQPGQALQLGQTYDVINGIDSYLIADGGFTIISADRQPENFRQETDGVYAVEDTLANRINAATPVFNGVPGLYAEQFGGVPVPTYDVDIANEADARVGNTLYPLESVVGAPGQGGYTETTVAAGFYLGGSLTGGLGNQEKVTTTIESDMELQLDELRIRSRIDTFEIPRFRTETAVIETTTTTHQAGTARFHINERGEIVNARFLDGEVLSVDVNEQEISRTQEGITRGDRQRIDRVFKDEFEPVSSEVIMGDQSSARERETAANFAPVEGELALGGLLNFGNTPWTPAANTLRAELFARDTVFGRSSGSAEVGWRAEAVFHPFGELQREAFQYDRVGNVVPVYQTRPLIDASTGKQIMETVAGIGDALVEVPVNAFATDELGDRIPQMVGTGTPKGPGVYLRLEDAFDDGESVLFAGGLQFSF
ncbi:MAG: hypothetical protein AAFV85_22355 [Cyanobacteria bacterium J06634_6]